MRPGQLSVEGPLEPLCNLNASSAKAATFAVRVVFAGKGKFHYGPNTDRKTMHTFECLLVDKDPGSYVQAVMKSPKEELITGVAGKLVQGTTWKMWRIAIDYKFRPQYISAPIKSLVDVYNTKFEPLVDNAVELAQAPIPKTRIESILKIQNKKKFYDVAGVLVSGPTNERTPMTKQGPKAAADFRLLQPASKPGEPKVALEFTVWGGHIGELTQLVGKPVALYKMVIIRKSGSNVACEASWDARVVLVKDDPALISFISSLGIAGAPRTTVVTTKWTPHETALDVKGEQPLVSAGYLRHCEKNAHTKGTDTWQVCGCYLDIPTGNILTHDGSRIWFPTILRDVTGCIEVGVTEAAALGASGLRRKEEMLQAFQEGKLVFGRCNVRGGRTRTKDLEARYIIIACEPTQDVRPLTPAALSHYELLRRFGRTRGGIVAAPFSEINYDPFVGLTAWGLEVHKVLLLVRGLERSTLAVMNAQRKMSTRVQCAYVDPPTPTSDTEYTVVAFCHEASVADYKFDTGTALVVATGMNLVSDTGTAPKKYEIVADVITVIVRERFGDTRKTLWELGCIAKPAAGREEDDQAASTGKRKMEQIEWTPNKFCDTINAYPGARGGA